MAFALENQNQNISNKNIQISELIELCKQNINI